jgi:DNA-binding IscR family transcriptional regulator
MVPARPAREISLLEIYRAVDAPKAFRDSSIPGGKTMYRQLQYQIGSEPRPG